MARYVILAACVLAAITFITRSRRGERALKVIIGLMVLYVVLKLTGVIDLLRWERPGG